MAPLSEKIIATSAEMPEISRAVWVFETKLDKLDGVFERSEERKGGRMTYMRRVATCNRYLPR
jgi:hypothetical protein